MKTAADLTPLRFKLARPLVRPSAARTVGLAYLAAIIVLFVFVFKNASPIPIHDELCNIPFLVDHPPLADYWRQHNEHRIPLPRLLYVAAFWLFGGDFRGPQYFNALMLTAATGVVMLALRRSRGYWSSTDALVPLALLTTGQYGNLLWGFQVQFIASTSLVLMAIALSLAPGLMSSKPRLVGLGACGMLLPLCGANGLAFVPGICGVLFFAGVWNLWGNERKWSAGILSLALGMLPLTITAAYFVGLQDSTHHKVGEGTLGQMIVGAVNLLGACFGPIARHLPPRPYEGITVFGVLGVVLVAHTAVGLLAAMRDPATRPQAVAFAGVLFGFLVLAAGISKSRSGFCNVLDANRYYTLMLPMVVGAYAVWTSLGYRWMPRLLFVVVAAGYVPNAMIGHHECPATVWWTQYVGEEIRAGIPLEFIADRHRGLFLSEPEFRRTMLLHMGSKGLKPFSLAAPLPPLRHEPIPLTILSTENLVQEGHVLRVVGETGHVVFQLPRREFVYALSLRYEARVGGLGSLPNILSWESGGGMPRSHAKGVPHQLEPLEEPADTWVYINDEAETFRIDLWGDGAVLKVHSIHLLHRAD